LGTTGLKETLDFTSFGVSKVIDDIIEVKSVTRCQVQCSLASDRSGILVSSLCTFDKFQFAK